MLVTTSPWLHAKNTILALQSLEILHVGVYALAQNQIVHGEISFIGMNDISWNFWIKPLATKDLILELEKKLEVIAELAPMMNKLSVHQLVIAKREEFSWARGLVRSVTSNGAVVVLFVDYGQTEVVSPNLIRSAAPEVFTLLPLQALLCELRNCQGNLSLAKHIAGLAKQGATFQVICQGYKIVQGAIVYEVDLEVDPQIAIQYSGIAKSAALDNLGQGIRDSYQMNKKDQDQRSHTGYHGNSGQWRHNRVLQLRDSNTPAARKHAGSASTVISVRRTVTSPESATSSATSSPARPERMRSNRLDLPNLNSGAHPVLRKEVGHGLTKVDSETHRKTTRPARPCLAAPDTCVPPLDMHQNDKKTRPGSDKLQTEKKTECVHPPEVPDFKIKQRPVINRTILQPEKKAECVHPPEVPDFKIKQRPVINRTILQRLVPRCGVLTNKMERTWRKTTTTNISSSSVQDLTCDRTSPSSVIDKREEPTDAGGGTPRGGKSSLLGKRSSGGGGEAGSNIPRKRPRHFEPTKSELDMELPRFYDDEQNQLLFANQITLRPKTFTLLTDPGDISVNQFDMRASKWISNKKTSIPFNSVSVAMESVQIGLLEKVPHPAYVQDMLNIMHTNRQHLAQEYGLTMDKEIVDVILSRSSVLVNGRCAMDKEGKITQRCTFELTYSFVTQHDIDEVFGSMAATCVTIQRPIKTIRVGSLTILVMDYLSYTLTTFLRNHPLNGSTKWTMVVDLLSMLAKFEDCNRAQLVDLSLSAVGVNLDEKGKPHLHLSLQRGTDQTHGNDSKKNVKKFAAVMVMILSHSPLQYVAGHWVVPNLSTGEMCPILMTISQMLSRCEDLVPTFANLRAHPVFGTNSTFVNLVQNSSDLFNEDMHGQVLRDALSIRVKEERLLYLCVFESWKDVMPEDLVKELTTRSSYNDRPVSLLRVFRNTNNHTIQFVAYLYASSGDLKDENLASFMNRYYPLFFTWLLSQTDSLKVYRRMKSNYLPGPVCDPFTFVELHTVRLLLKLHNDNIQQQNVYFLSNLLFQVEATVQTCSDVTCAENQCHLLTSMLEEKHRMDNVKMLPFLEENRTNEDSLKLQILGLLKKYLTVVQENTNSCPSPQCLIHSMFYDDLNEPDNNQFNLPANCNLC